MGEEALAYILLDYENSHCLFELFSTAEVLTLSRVRQNRGFGDRVFPSFNSSFLRFPFRYAQHGLLLSPNLTIGKRFTHTATNQPLPPATSNYRRYNCQLSLHQFTIWVGEDGPTLFCGSY
jgi:hypothetical protein